MKVYTMLESFGAKPLMRISTQLKAQGYGRETFLLSLTFSSVFSAHCDLRSLRRGDVFVPRSDSTAMYRSSGSDRHCQSKFVAEYLSTVISSRVSEG